ncbi:MAG: hypothetical protein V7K21_26435 [Nostoc sp.]|uniref:hypothetical protein n=1 Tax=Nostoc sp. TaxID=1180 RepID=UPI002FF59903
MAQIKQIIVNVLVLYQRPSRVLLADSYGLARVEWGISLFYSELGTQKGKTVLPHDAS